MTEIIRDVEGIRNAIRRRRDELNISHETIDNLAGFQQGYTSKLLAPDPIKGFGIMSLPAMLGALAIGLKVVEDPEQRARVEGRWIKRKRPQRLPPSASALSMPNEVPAVWQITEELQAKMERSARMKEIGILGASKGGKASAKKRAKTMGKRARQRAASHAARMRWAKRERPAEV